MRELASLLVMLVWLAGAVLADGFWSTLLALVMPLWGLYLVVERVMQWAGWA